MSLFVRRMLGAFKRTVPCCVPQTQAIAFNMFLGLVPTVLMVLGIVAQSETLRFGLLDTVRPFRPVLPLGLYQLLAEFVSQPETRAWQWISIGLGGTLLVGTQMMRLIIDGFRMVYRDGGSLGYWGRTLRALVLLVMAIAPWLFTAVLIIFGKLMRTRMIESWGSAKLVSAFASVIYQGLALTIVMGVLAMIYSMGRPGSGGWKTVMPGAAVATALWWLVSSALGIYMRSVHYRAIYGGLEVAIGLMLWMELTATIILVGAAYNAERASSA